MSLQANRGRVAKVCVEERRVRPLAELGWGFARILHNNSSS